MKFSKNKNSIFVMFVVLLLLLSFVSTKYFVASGETGVKIKIIPTDYEGETVLKPRSEEYHAEINLEYSLFMAAFDIDIVDNATGK